MEGYYRLIKDDDGHWYVIPAEKEDEVERYFQAVYNYWRPGSSYDTELPDEPDYLTPIGGRPSCIVFKEYKVDTG